MTKISISHLSQRAVQALKSRATATGQSVEMQICMIVETATHGGGSFGLEPAHQAIGQQTGVHRSCAAKTEGRLVSSGARLWLLAIRELLNAGLAREKNALTARARLIEGFLSSRSIDPEIADVINLALEVFESEERAYAWLITEHAGLMGRTPLTLLADGQHVEVHDLLAPFWMGQ